MKNNNGKIAIAIVAMFVVALSVVGFTYAYFTATVQGNEATKSVEVTAGKLEIVYSNGTILSAQNLVPGWTSDGKHYYDPDYSATLVGSQYQIKAVTTIEHATKSTGGTPTTADGITNDATFKVSNAEDNAGDNSFIIRLKGIENGIATTDQQHLWVTLYSVVGSQKTVVWAGNLNATSSVPQVIVPDARNITSDGDEQSYSVRLTYQNADSAQSSKGASVKAEVEVIGVVCNSGTCVDADGNNIKFPSENTTEPAIDLTSQS